MEHRAKLMKSGKFVTDMAQLLSKMQQNLSEQPIKVFRLEHLELITAFPLMETRLSQDHPEECF